MSGYGAKPWSDEDDEDDEDDGDDGDDQGGEGDEFDKDGEKPREVPVRGA